MAETNRISKYVELAPIRHRHLTEISVEQLVHRYQEVLGTTYLSFEERSWLEVVFEKFATRPGYWSESDLTSFLSLSFPEPSTQLLREAGPTLYRLLLRVGSYPYHQDPSKKLDLSTLRTATVILLRNDEYRLWFSYGDEEENECAARLQARYPRLLFQALAPTPDLNTDEMGESDDEDVVEALRVISQRKFIRDPTNPKIGTPVPKTPRPSSFPSSHARMLDGQLSRVDLQVLLRLFLACQLYWGGSGPEHVIASPSNGFDRAADSLYTAFELDQEGNCGWRSFDRAIAKQKTGLYMAMPRILDPLIKGSQTIDTSAFASLPRAEATNLLRSNYQSAESRFPTPGAILTLPLLSQLTMFLPEDLLFDKAKLLFWTKGGEQKMPHSIKAHLDDPSADSLLLISAKTKRGPPSSPTGTPTVCGVYLPSSQEPTSPSGAASRPIVFQCEPEHRIWPGTIDRRRSSLRGVLTKADGLALRVDATPRSHAGFQVDSRLREGSLTLPSDGEAGACDVLRFSVEYFEVFDVPHAMG